MWRGGRHSKRRVHGGQVGLGGGGKEGMWAWGVGEKEVFGVRGLRNFLSATAVAEPGIASAVGGAAYPPIMWHLFGYLVPSTLHPAPAPCGGCTLYHESCTCTLHPTPCTLYPVPCTLYPVPCTLYPVPCTLHPVPCTLYPAPCTLYPAPCTLHPVPYTLRPAPTPPALSGGQVRDRGAHRGAARGPAARGHCGHTRRVDRQQPLKQHLRLRGIHQGEAGARCGYECLPGTACYCLKACCVPACYCPLLPACYCLEACCVPSWLPATACYCLPACLLLPSTACLEACFVPASLCLFASVHTPSECPCQCAHP